MNAELLEKSIIELLPPVPYIVDQVGAAMNWVKSVVEEGEYLKSLRVALKVAEYTAKVSNPNFYKSNLIIASLLSNVPNATEDEKFKIFDTASKSVEKMLKSVVVESKLQEDKGCFKALTLHLIPLFENDQDAAVVMLCGIWEDLEDIARVLDKAEVKTPITREDYVIILGYTVVLGNIYASKPNILNETGSILNEIQIILNRLSY